MKVKEENEKVGLKFNIQKTKILASGPITSQQIDRETVQTVSDFIFWGSKITADGDCSHEIKRLKDAYSLEGKLRPTQIAYSKAETLLCPSSQGYGFSSGHVQMRELDCEES